MVLLPRGKEPKFTPARWLRVEFDLMDALKLIRCCVCARTPEDVRLAICPTCAKRVCAEHAFRRSGKFFCTKQCAEWFFYGDPEDLEPEE